MATQTSTLQVKGKLGNVVGYRGRGKQLARIRVTEIKNPNTEAQAIQRMITATNARAYSRLKSICDHSFEGIAYKQASQDFFLKENAKRIRQWVANNYPAVTETDPNNYVGLSGVDDAYASGVGCLISKGSLPSIPALRGDDGLLVGFGESAMNPVGDDTPSIATVLAQLGAEPGDQITVLALTGSILRKARLIIKSDATAEQLALPFGMHDPSSASPSGYSAAFLAVLDERSQFDSVAALELSQNDDDQYLIHSWDGAGVAEGAAIILSRKAADGAWLRSTQTLVWAGDADTAGLEAPEMTVPEWVAGKTDINVANPWYLNQAKTPASTDF